MMNARDIARGGVLAAAALVLLYFAGAASYAAVALCVCAGVTSAVPLLHRARLRTAVLLYAAVSALGLLLVPRKAVVVAYILFCGLYPIVKFEIESRMPRRLQTGAKLVYCNIVLAVAAALAVFVFAPEMAVSGLARVVLLLAAADAAFLMYDMALSRLIAVLRRSLPPE